MERLRKMRIQIDERLFFEWLKTKGLKERSQYEYISCLRRFDLTNFDQEHINEFINLNKGSYVCRAFLNNLFKYVKRNTTYASEVKDYVNGLYVENVTGRKPQKKLRAITESQMKELARGLDGKDQLLLYISFYCGLRIDEIFGDDFNTEINPLTYGQFNFTRWSKYPKEDSELTIKGKGNKERVIPVPAWLMKYVYVYGRNEAKNKTDVLFDFSQSRWVKLLREESNHVLGIKLRTHELRASCATYLFIVKKMDIVEVSKFLGHENINTTQRYLDLSKDLKKRYMKD
jgi:integrase